jgi:hypothetical protein
LKSIYINFQFYSVCPENNKQTSTAFQNSKKQAIMKKVKAEEETKANSVRIEGHRLHKQVFELYNKSILSFEEVGKPAKDPSKQKIKFIEKVAAKKSSLSLPDSSSIDLQNLTLTQPILLGSEELKSIDSVLLGVSLPIEIISLSTNKTDISSPVFFGSLFQDLEKAHQKNSLLKSKQHRKPMKLEVIQQKYLKNILSRLLKNSWKFSTKNNNNKKKTRLLSSENEEKEMISLLQEFRDLPFLLYLEQKLFSSSESSRNTFQLFLSHFLYFTPRELNSIHSSFQLLQKANKKKKKNQENHSPPEDGKSGKKNTKKEKAKKKAKEEAEKELEEKSAFSWLSDRFLPKEFLLELQLFLDSQPEEKIVYDNKRRKGSPTSQQDEQKEEEDDVEEL